MRTIGVPHRRMRMGAPMLDNVEALLAVQIVNGLTRCLCCLAGRLLDRSGDLVSHAVTRQLFVPGRSADALFQLAGETTTDPGNALLRPPQSGPAGSVLHVIVSGRIPRTRLIEHNVGCDAGANTRNNPSKSFHLTFSLAVGCVCRKGRQATLN